MIRVDESSEPPNMTDEASIAPVEIDLNIERLKVRELERKIEEFQREKDVLPSSIAFRH